MKHIYSISGMTCNGCRMSVEEKLNALPDVIKALVNLETAMEENKNGSLYYLICKAIAFVWYICFSIIVYKYLLLSYEN